MAPDRVWQEHDGKLSPLSETQAEEFEMVPRPDNHSSHPVCRRPMLWKLVAYVLALLGAGILALAVWGATIVADQRVNDAKHQQLDGTLMEMRGDIKELLRRTSSGKSLTMTAGDP